MFLCSLRNLLRDCGCGSLAKGLHRLVERPDINDKNQYVLQTETSYPFLQEHIQYFGTLESNIEPGDEELRLKEAFDYLNESLKGAASSIQDDTTLTDEKKRTQLNARLREYFASSLNLKQAKRALCAVEKFHFVFTAVTSQRSSGGISFMYALHARQLQAANTQAAKIQQIDTLLAKLKDKVPAYQEFEANFRTVMASEKFTKRKSLVLYILGKMSRELGKLSLDMSRMTIEHLAHQSQGKGGALTDEQIAEIGNLLLVDEPLNGKLGTKPFSDKLKLLKVAPAIWVDDFLRKQTSWGQNEIRNRTDHLAKLAFEKVWRV